jgi:hypothetical protein
MPTLFQYSENSFQERVTGTRNGSEESREKVK